MSGQVTGKHYSRALLACLILFTAVLGNSINARPLSSSEVTPTLVTIVEKVLKQDIQKEEERSSLPLLVKVTKEEREKVKYLFREHFTLTNLLRHSIVIAAP